MDTNTKEGRVSRRKNQCPVSACRQLSRGRWLVDLAVRGWLITRPPLWGMLTPEWMWGGGKNGPDIKAQTPGKAFSEAG